MIAYLGRTSVIGYVFIQDSSSTTGAGLTGVAYNSAGIAAYMIRPGGTLTTLTLETISTLGTYAAPTSNAHLRIKELSSANAPGWYEIHYHDDWFSTANAWDGVGVVINGVTNMAQVNQWIDVNKSLRPTTAGRTLDVSTGGEAGLDWANIGSPTTTVGLSGTTVKTATDVETDTQDIQSRLPAALGANGNIKADVRDYNGAAGTFASGRPETNVNSIAAGAITASAIAADAIGASELAADAATEIATAVWASATRELTALDEDNTTIDLNATAVGSVVGAVGSVTGNVGGNVTGSVGSLATQAKADVNAEVVDALNTDTYAEPGQEAPGATVSLVKKIGYLYKAWRNKSTETSTTFSLYADDGTTVDQKATLSDDGTTFTSGEVGTGP